MRRCRKWAAIAAAIPVAGALFQYLLTAWTLHGAPLLGTRVDVGGRSLHVVCRGRGIPTVFLDATALGGASQWARVQDALAAEVEVCAYDRAGVGFSDPGPAPRDAAALGRDLERVAATRPPPYILGAGSSGGLAVRSYLAAHPDRVAGVLLADAFTDNFDALPRSYAKAVRLLRAAQVFSRFGVLRLANPFGIGGSVDKALFYRPQAWDAAASLVANFPSSLAQLRNAPIPPNLPLRVLTHTRPGGIMNVDYDEEVAAEETWQCAQQAVAARSSRGTYQKVEGAAHVIVADRPDAVVTALRELIAEARRPNAAKPPATSP